MESAQEHFRSQLIRRFIELKAEIPTYSLRSFAKDLGQNPAAVSQILNGKRNVSLKLAVKLAERIGFSSSQIAQLSSQTFLRKNGLPLKPGPDVGSTSMKHNRSVLSMAHYDVVAD